MCYKIIKSQKDLKLKARSKFPNVWGEYKNHSNPYIRGTTVPCDLHARYISATLASPSPNVSVPCKLIARNNFFVSYLIHL